MRRMNWLVMFVVATVSTACVPDTDKESPADEVVIENDEERSAESPRETPDEPAVFGDRYVGTFASKIYRDGVIVEREEKEATVAQVEVDAFGSVVVSGITGCAFELDPESSVVAPQRCTYVDLEGVTIELRIEGEWSLSNDVFAVELELERYHPTPSVPVEDVEAIFQGDVFQPISCGVADAEWYVGSSTTYEWLDCEDGNDYLARCESDIVGAWTCECEEFPSNAKSTFGLDRDVSLPTVMHMNMGCGWNVPYPAEG